MNLKLKLIELFQDDVTEKNTQNNPNVYCTIRGALRTLTTTHDNIMHLF